MQESTLQVFEVRIETYRTGQPEGGAARRHKDTCTVPNLDAGYQVTGSGIKPIFAAPLSRTHAD